MLRLSLAALVLLAPRPVDDPLPTRDAGAVVERILELSADDPRVMEHLDYLCGTIGPRLTGSSNLQRACEWARARFAAMGLDARLERWGETPVGFERGVSRGGMVEPLRIDYAFGTNAWTPGTPGPVRAPARLYPRSVDEALERRDELAGAWVVDLPRDERPRLLVRREIDEALAELGIAGRIHDAGPLIHTSGNMQVDPEDLPRTVHVSLRREFYGDLVSRLLARAEDGEDVVLELDVDNRFLPGPVPQYNVVADLVGSELPDEYVVVGGHIDSWDGAVGAQDNGTGVATTLEAARLLTAAGARPRRTIRFVLWGGEEQGLLGSRAYVEAHADEMERTSAVFVHDEGTGYLAGVAGPPALHGQLVEALAPLVGLSSDMPFVVEENEGLRQGGGSDHAPFVRAGVPGFFWRQEGRADYRWVHHTENDHLDEVVPEYLIHSARVVAIGALGVANLDRLLDRTGLVREGRGTSTRRRMGVSLDGNEVTRVFEDSMAAGAGWQEGDLILSIDGVDVDGQREIVSELQKGGPRKTVRLDRGGEVIETVLDYTDTPSEKAREAEARAKEEEAATAE